MHQRFIHKWLWINMHKNCIKLMNYSFSYKTGLYLFYCRPASRKRKRSDSLENEAMSPAKRARLLFLWPPMPRTYYLKVKQWHDMKEKVALGKYNLGLIMKMKKPLFISNMVITNTWLPWILSCADVFLPSCTRTTNIYFSQGVLF